MVPTQESNNENSKLWDASDSEDEDNCDVIVVDVPTPVGKIKSNKSMSYISKAFFCYKFIVVWF